MECSENVQLSLPGRPRPVVLGRRPQQLALGLQQEDSARVRRRVVSGQNQRQEASVQLQEVHLAQQSLRVVDLAVDSARVRPQVDLVLRRQAGSAQHQRQAGLGLLERVVLGHNQPQEASVQPQEVHLVQ